MAGYGVLVVLAVTVPAFILLPRFFQSRQPVDEADCMTSAKRLSLAVTLYLQDHDHVYPPARQWETVTAKYVVGGPPIACPKRPKVSHPYAFNPEFDRKKLVEISDPAKAPLLFESGSDRPNANDPLLSFVTPHRGAGVILFSDGRAEAVSTPPVSTAGQR